MPISYQAAFHIAGKYLCFGSTPMFIHPSILSPF